MRRGGGSIKWGAEGSKLGTGEEVMDFTVEFSSRNIGGKMGETGFICQVDRWLVYGLLFGEIGFFYFLRISNGGYSKSGNLL